MQTASLIEPDVLEPPGEVVTATAQPNSSREPEKFSNDDTPRASASQASSSETLSFRGRYPKTLAFGTSGLRGLVADITDLEAYVNTRGFLEFALEYGEAAPGQEVSIAADLRPSSDGPERTILRAVARAIEDSGLQVEYLGRLPTPALTFYALSRKRPSIMVTGSHIPFDRNGIKFNLSRGEVLKRDEAAILRAVKRVRRREYERSNRESAFADDGMFKCGQDRPLPEVNSQACLDYLCRYLNFFTYDALDGQRIIFYQHSAVGRDLLLVLLTSLGAEVIPVGRSENFVPVDTEAITEDKLQLLQDLVDEARRTHGPFDAIVSTDGDSDRPLLAGITPEGRVKFCSGDLLGIIAAEFLGADIVAVPISANDAVDHWATTRGVNVVKTRIGSPYVIEAMQQLEGQGKVSVVGWEANGGFMTATDLARNGRILSALPTRDAALPLLAALCAAKERRISLTQLFETLPARFGKAGLIDNLSPETSRALLGRFAPLDPDINDVAFKENAVSLQHTDGRTEDAVDTAQEYEVKRKELEHFFGPDGGFGSVSRMNTLDGLRVWFDNGEIVHIRPSGNAPQLRVYAVAGTQTRADEIVAMALHEPHGVLQQMIAAVAAPVPPTGLVGQVRDNIALTAELFARGETPEVIGTVSGSWSAQRFWRNILDRARKSFKAREAISFAEDLPTNQAFGLLLLWQRLKPHLHESRGALIAFVIGDGTRSTPITETDGAQKAAIATFVPDSTQPGARFFSMVELALRFFVPVQQFLRRSGFDGLVVKWGDEVQIPTRDLSGAAPLFANADIVRFVSLRQMNADEAKNKDWVGVNESGHITAFIPRRPFEAMEALAKRGLLQRRQGRLWGGINLGSIAVSRALLNCLLKEFHNEVNTIHAEREHRPALDPEFFMALTVAAIDDPEQRAAEWERATEESAEVRNLNARFPDVLCRVRRAICRLEDREGRKLKMVAMDFGDQYWGDIGQHSKMYEFYMALNQDGPSGEIARAIAGLPGKRDARGNLIVNSVIAQEVRVSNSVLINTTLSGRGVVERSVLIGTCAANVEVHEGFDVLSTVSDLRIEPRGGTYKVVSSAPVHAGPDERMTTLFLPGFGPKIFRVKEETDLKNKAANYSNPILGNALSFQQAHVEMGTLEPEALESRRSAAESAVLKLPQPSSATIRPQEFQVK